MATVAVLGAFDTKGDEFHYLIREIEKRKHKVLRIDFGVLKEPPFQVEVSSSQVAEAGGVSLTELRRKNERGEAMRVMASGAAKVISGLYRAGKIDGLVAMGGSGGTSVFLEVARNLPLGFPKVLVSTLANPASGDALAIHDFVLVPAVVDLAGLNRISRQVIHHAAHAICGMVEGGRNESEEEKPIIAATMLGNTTPAVECARRVFENAGYEVLVFHAIGNGGRTMENLILGGWIDAVFDLTTVELASELVGSAAYSAGPQRLTAAAQKGLPQAVSVGCLDFAIFARPETIPKRYRSRLFYRWNPETTLMRTTPSENERLGREIAQKLNLSKGSCTVWFPKRGFSQLDIPGGPFWNPEADLALLSALQDTFNPLIRLVEMDAQINDSEFAAAMAEKLLEDMRSGT
ncbi:MAG: Tm-1-like ATP-binding domain-containing protein [Anaerolineales bacterium]